ncbi:MAG: rhodanese-like domain-containing protein [Gammaproteobacteria bacterium]|nr:rhodanese-like domain-containing protein [Gammaproteobacteria bacterium]
MDQFVEFARNHWGLFLALVVVVALLIGNEVMRLLRRYREVTPAEATNLTNRENAVMLDIRDPKEYREGHIINAKHVPLGELDRRVKELERYKDRPVVAYCRTGQQSARACALLEKQGFQPVYNLKGGIQAWRNAHLPVTKE